MFESSTDAGSTLSFPKFATEDHRRFHDRIVADLNGILPVCNQGKCTAADISDSSTEQQQITDLMQKVEHLCAQLSENVTDLFSQYYRERGRFCGVAYCTTAEIKDNLLERTLQDRSTDVRWWSKEPILANAVTTLRKLSTSLEDDMQEMSAYLEGAIAAFRIPSLSGDWTSMDIADRVNEVTPYFSRIRDLMFNEQVRNEFIGVVRNLIELLESGEKQDAAIKFARKLIKKLQTCETRVQEACRQLDLIRDTYPSLFDIIVTDDQGTVIATARSQDRDNLLSTSVGDQSWCRVALESNVNNTHIERVMVGPEQKPAIVFASSIRDSEERQGGSLGIIAVFCDFQSEVHELLDNYLPRDPDGRTRDGWFSLFTDKRGAVICSNDPDAIPPGSHCELPRSHRQLAIGEKRWSTLVFNGRDSFVFSACSAEQHALGENGWVSHVIAPAADIMQAVSGEARLPLQENQLLNSKLVPEISKATYAALQEDRKAIKLISLNGILFASQLGKRGAALAPVFDKITATGDSATNRMESLLYEMASSEIDLNLRLQEVLAKQAVDLISQKIHERAKGLRLWARTSRFQELLGTTSEEGTKEVENLLKLINDDYPSYRNILLIDVDGEIRAASRPKQLAEQEIRYVADQPWYLSSIRSAAKAAPQIAEFRLQSNDGVPSSALVFSQGVPDSERETSMIGVLACLFDWKAESAEVISACLPKTPAGRTVPGAMALFTNQNQMILQSTNSSVLPPGEYFNLPEAHMQLPPGQTISSSFELNNENYILASARGEMQNSQRAINWVSHVLRPLN